ncbi:MAG: hypothetical protein AAGA96_00390 [Verrucomicrobiota bacterium]
MGDDGDSTEASRVALQTHVEELRRRCEAVGRFQGGPTYYGEEVSLFRTYCDEGDFWFSQAPEEVEDAPDDEGNEHQVWFLSQSNSYLKVTWPDFFGKLVVFSSADTPNASPIGYLERWHLHNELFGDSAEFLGAWESSQGLRLVIRQPAIAGAPATEAQIRQFFEETGWQPFQIGLDLAFFDPERAIAISDTHPGNLVLMEDGMLAPIDLRVQPLTPSLVDAVEKLSDQYGSHP